MEKISAQDQALFTRVYEPTFIKRCAARGLEITDRDTLEQALETTALVHKYLQDKQANVIKSAAASLKDALGVNKKEAALNEQQERLSRAFEFGRDPEIRNAILAEVNRAA